MQTAAGIGKTPYVATIGARVCDCAAPVKEVGRSKDLERAITRISGYWNVYLGFFGNQIVWLNFDIIDARDGVVVWRNGRLTQKEAGQLDFTAGQDEDTGAGRGAGAVGSPANRR